MYARPRVAAPGPYFGAPPPYGPGGGPGGMGMGVGMVPGSQQEMLYDQHQRGAGGSGSVSSSSAAQGPGSRFEAHPFQYNGRVACALVPCVLVLLGAGGVLVVTTLVAGLMLSYLLDALQFRRGAFVAIWVSFFTTAAALAFSGVAFGPHIPIPLSVLLLLTAMNLVFLCGVWVSLQFRWLQLEHPTVVLTLERLLFACCPITGAAIQTWGLVSSVGILYASFYLLPTLFLLYWLFSIPQQSSFRSRRPVSAANETRIGGAGTPGASKETEIQGPLEGSVHALLVLLLPSAFHVAVHHSRLLDASLTGVADSLLLFFLPLLFLLFASTRGSLSWLVADQRKLHPIRIGLGGVALAVVLACLELRVIFPSFMHYLHFPPPFNYLLVTLAVYGIAFGAAAHVAGILRGTAGTALVLSVLLVSTISGSLVLGMPWKMLPAPAIAAVYLAHYHSNSTVSSYFIFAAAATLSVAWFLMHNFYFLSVAVGAVSIKAVCQWLLLGVALALCVPGLTLFPRAQALAGVVAVAQALLVCGIEDILYNNDHVDENIYPSYLVVLSTVVGYVAIRRLRAEAKIGAWAAWLATCFYLAKLAMLFVSVPWVVQSASALLLAVTPPLLLYREKSKGGVSGSRMQAWQGYAHAGIIAAAVWFSRFTLFDIVLAVTGHKPHHSLLIGLLGLVVACACLPIAFIHFPNNQEAKRIALLAVGAALLFLTLQPPLPPAWHTVWDAQHYPEDEDEPGPDDLDVYGLPPQGPIWTAWLLYGTLVTAAGVFTSAIPVHKVEPLRLGFVAGIGASAGVYVCAKFVSKLNPLLHLLLIASLVLALVFASFTHHPAPWSPRLMPALFALEVALLPVSYLAVGPVKQTKYGGTDDMPVQWIPDWEDEILKQGARTSVLGLFCAIYFMMALVVKFKIAVAVREKVAGAGAGAGVGAGSANGGDEDLIGNGDSSLPNQSPFIAPHRSLQHRKAGLLAAFSSKKSWMPGVGNAAVLFCFLLSLLLIPEISDARPDRAIFFVVPILLLLNHDAAVMASFGDRQRYFPLTVSLSLYLTVYALYSIFHDTIVGFYYAGWSAHTENLQQILFLGKNFVVLMLCMPMHVLFNRFMWDYVKQSDYLLLLLGPLNVPGLVVTDVNAVRILGGLGLVYSVVQYALSRQIRLAGQRFI